MNDILTIKLSEKGVNCAVGRVVGIKIKDSIIEEYNKGNYKKIVLDFTDIDFVTSGFAKELFSGLSLKFGDSLRHFVSIRVDKGNTTMKNNLIRALSAAIISNK